MTKQKWILEVLVKNGSNNYSFVVKVAKLDNKTCFAFVEITLVLNFL